MREMNLNLANYSGKPLFKTAVVDCIVVIYEFGYKTKSAVLFCGTKEQYITRVKSKLEVHSY
jgi:hypothetical protein